MDTTRQRIAIAILGILAVVVPTLTLLALDDDEPTAEPVDVAADGGDAAGFSLEPADQVSVPAIDAVPAPSPTVDERLDIVSLIAADARLEEMSALLRTSGVAAALDGDGPFTVLVPVTTSFDARTLATESDAETDAVEPIDVLSDPERAIAVVAYHIISGNLSVDDLTKAAERGARTADVTTLQGETISLTSTADGLLLNGSVLVTEPDLEATNGTVHIIDSLLVPIGVQLDALVAARPIRFEPANSNFTEDTVAVLDAIVAVLAETDVPITIHGHTDDAADEITNQNLSQSRARAVLNYLVENGIDEERLSAQGFGPSQPIADNDTEEGRALNRRIEFIVG